jgi:hypothetical protein
MTTLGDSNGDYYDDDDDDDDDDDNNNNNNNNNGERNHEYGHDYEHYRHWGATMALDSSINIFM